MQKCIRGAEEVSEPLKKIKPTIHCKIIEDSQHDQAKKYSVIEDLQDSSKQKSVAFMVND